MQLEAASVTCGLDADPPWSGARLWNVLDPADCPDRDDQLWYHEAMFLQIKGSNFLRSTRRVELHYYYPYLGLNAHISLSLSGLDLHPCIISAARENMRHENHGNINGGEACKLF